MTTPVPCAPEVITLGCRLNAGEGEGMRALATAAGLEGTVIVNTCAVTAEAVRQSAQAVRRLRRERPAARIVATGCAVQTETERFAAMPEANYLIGNGAKLAAATYAAIGNGKLPRVAVEDIMAVRHADTPAFAARSRIPRAFVQVQNGCDHRCTFCIIPYGRGRSRSLSAATVIAEIGRLVEAGVPEVVLTGVDITSWGDDMEGRPRLGALVRAILRNVPGLPRLRLSSIDQAEADPELLSAFAEEERLMPHVHLSLQSGSDLILKRMRRRHSRAEAIALTQTLRRLRPDIAIGADVIAGFPTETEAHFEDTLSVIDACGLAFLHVFPYSARLGTPAARMPPVAPPLVQERAGRLRKKGQDVLGQWLQSHVGCTLKAALERAGAAVLPARTRQFTQVLLADVPSGAAAGESLQARVTGHDGRRLIAEAIR